MISKQVLSCGKLKFFKYWILTLIFMPISMTLECFLWSIVRLSETLSFSLWPSQRGNEVNFEWFFWMDQTNRLKSTIFHILKATMNASFVIKDPKSWVFFHSHKQNNSKLDTLSAFLVSIKQFPRDLKNQKFQELIYKSIIA